MTKSFAPRYGLVAAGAAGRSPVLDLPSLRRGLGPVASSSTKVAGRIARALKGGKPARDLAELDACGVILACAPDTGLDRIVSILDSAPIDWHGKILLFCDSGVSSIDFTRFKDQGAFTGSLNSIQGLPKSFVIEGGRHALREAKRMVRELAGNGIEVNSDAVRFFEAAVTFSNSLFTPLLDSCVECLQESGMERKMAVSVAESLFQFSLRSYLHSGRRAWAGPVAEYRLSALESQYEALRSQNPLRAEYFRNSADFASELYRSFPELARYLPKH